MKKEIIDDNKDWMGILEEKYSNKKDNILYEKDGYRNPTYKINNGGI